MSTEIRERLNEKVDIKINKSPATGEENELLIFKQFKKLNFYLIERFVCTDFLPILRNGKKGAKASLDFYNIKIILKLEQYLEKIRHIKLG